MNYSEILAALNNASLFELHRLNVAIHQQLKDPVKFHQLKNRLKSGQLISYFDSSKNSLIAATIVELKKTKVLVENRDNGELWNIAYYCINIDDSDTDIQSASQQKINRNTLKVGDKVCFIDKKGHELFGEVIKLNPKTAGILVAKEKWRVTYNLLSMVIDGELWHEQQLIDHQDQQDHQDHS